MAQAKTVARATQDASAGATFTTARPAMMQVAATPQHGAGADAVDRSLDRLEQEIFLSTRVVDQRSFEELAGTLQRIIRESVTQGRSLLTASDQVRGVSDNLRALIRDLQQRTEQAAKAAPMLEAKLTRAQTLVSRVTNESALAKAREMRDAVLHELAAQREVLVREAVEQAIVESRAKIDAAVQKALADALAQEPVMQGLLQRLPMPAQAPAPVAMPAPTPVPMPIIQTVLDDTRARGVMAQLERLIREGEAHAERAEARLAAVQASTEGALAQAEAGEKSLEESLLRAQLRFKHVVEEHERRTENVATEIAEQLLALRSDAQAQVAKAQGLIDSSRLGAADALRQMLERSRSQLVEQAAGELAERSRSAMQDATQRAIERATGEIERIADGAVQRVEAVTDATHDTIRSVCTQALDDVGTRLMQLREQRATLEQEVHAQAAKAREQLEKAGALALEALRAATPPPPLPHTPTPAPEATPTPAQAPARDLAAEGFFGVDPSTAGLAHADTLEQLQQAIDAAHHAIEATHAAIEELRTLRDDADGAREALGEQVSAAGEAVTLVDARVTHASTLCEKLEQLEAHAEQAVRQPAATPAPTSVPIDQIGSILSQLIRSGVVQAPPATPSSPFTAAPRSTPPTTARPAGTLGLQTRPASVSPTPQPLAPRSSVPTQAKTLDAPPKSTLTPAPLRTTPVPPMRTTPTSSPNSRPQAAQPPTPTPPPPSNEKRPRTERPGPLG